MRAQFGGASGRACGGGRHRPRLPSARSDRRGLMAQGHSNPLHLPDGVEHAGFDPCRPTRSIHPSGCDGATTYASFAGRPSSRACSWTRSGAAVRAARRGSHVLLIPGFLAGDESLGILASWLKRVGYQPRRAGIHVNVACSDRARPARRAPRAHLSTERATRRAHRPQPRWPLRQGARDAAAERVRAVISMSAVSTRRSKSAFRQRPRWPPCARRHRRASDPARQNGCLTEACSSRFARDYAAPFPEGSRSPRSTRAATASCGGRRAPSPTPSASRSPAATSARLQPALPTG